MSKKVLSMFLALSMIFTMLPGSILADGGGSHREIVAFAELEETEKTIMPGTALEDLGLPETLTATVMVPRIADSGDTDSGNIDSGDGYSEFIVPVPVTTWVSTPEYDIEAEAGTEYIFTPVIERYTVIAALPQIKVTVGAPPRMMSLLGAAPGSGTNLLVNPDGETFGDYGLLSANGWTEDNSPARGYSYEAFSNFRGITLSPHGGTYFMGFFATGGMTGTTYPDGISCYQNITVGTQRYYQLSGYLCVKNDSSGSATLRLEAVDGTGNKIGTYKQTVTKADGDWKPVTLTGPIPSGTAKLRITIEGVLNSTGLAAFDDLSLLLSDTPFPTDTGYNLWVGGVRVTDANKDNITGTGITGSVTYNSDTNTLTLNGATILATAYYSDGDDNFGIYAGQDLNIVLQGINSVTTESAKKSKAICVPDNTLTIDGDGLLTATGSSGASSAGWGIFADDLTINGGTVVAKVAPSTEGWGIHVVNQPIFNDGIITVTGSKGAIAEGNAPNITGYTSIKITASQNYTGTPTETYNTANITNYKYLKFEPSPYKAKIVETGQEYDTLEQAVTAVAEGQTIQLLKNIERPNYIYISKNFTLDLNGFTFDGTGYRTIIVGSGSTLTITDTSIAQGGKITNHYAENGPVIDVNTGGTLVVQDGTVTKDGNGYVIRNSGNLRILGGTVTNTGTESAIGSEGVLEVSGSSVVTARNAPAIKGSFSGSITVGGAAEVISANTSTDYNGGTIRLDHSIPLNITGGTIQNTAAYGIGISANASYQISVTSGSPVIMGLGKAMTHAPGLTDYNRVKVTASANYDGSEPAVEYKAANIANYKYLRFETSTGTTVTDLALTDKLTAPVTGGTPVTSITGDQYTGTVTWNGAPTKFLGSTIYTATVTLTAKTGYTFSSVAQNTLTHTGATANGVIHAAGTGDVLTVTVAFPKTAVKTLASIDIIIPPTKTAYKYGEFFSTVGIAVKAIYNDGTKADEYNYTHDKSGIPLSLSDTTVKIYISGYPSIYAEQPITVTKADQTIAIAEVKGKKYGDGTFTLSITGGKSTGDVTFTVPDGNGVLTLSGSTATIVGAGTVTVTATKAGDGNYNASNTATREITIAKAAQTISIGAVTDKKYGDAAFTLTASGGAGTGAVTFSVPDDNGVLALSGSTATIVGAGTVTVTATKAASTNHNSVSATSVITIGKAAAPAITYPTAAGITYGQTLSESALTGGSTQYGSFAWTNGSTVPTVSNNGYVVTFTPSAATEANYEAITPTTSIVAIAVAKAAAPVIIFPTAAGVHYGQRLSDSALTGGSTEYGSFAWTDGSTVPTVVNGGYEVTFTPSAHTVANYQEIINRKHTVPLLVSKVDATVTVNAVVSGNAGSRIATLTATVTGVAGGETPTGSVKFVDSTGTSDADIAGATAVTIANGQAVYTWTGLADQAYKVKAVYSGSDNYNAATSEEHSFDTRKQAQAALVIGDIGTKTYGDDTFTLSTTGGSGSGAVTFESSDPDIVSISGSTATIHKAGAVTITATKAEDGSFNEKSATVSLTVNKKTLTVKADDKLNIIKGSALPALTHTVTGLVGNDTFSAPIITTSADINTVGEYVISISGGTLSNADSYTVAHEKGRLTVINAVYTVTVVNGIGGGIYSEGATVTVTASTRSGYTFTSWSSDDFIFADNTAATTTFTMPGKAVTVTANYRQDSSGGGGDDDGGSTVSTPTTRHTSPNVDGSTGAVLQQAITREAATALGQMNNAAILHTQNAESIDPATLQALAQADKDVILHADTMLGSAVQGRLYVEPDKFVNTQQPLKLGVYTEPAKTSATTNLFENNFNNKVVTVHMEQQGSLGARLEVAAKANLSELDTKTLYFYSYDKAVNLYTRIWNPEYWTDVNGYLHFYTRLGGDIIITDRPLETK